MISYIACSTSELATTGNSVNYYLTSTVNKIRHGPVIALSLFCVTSAVSWLSRRYLSNWSFLLLLMMEGGFVITFLICCDLINWLRRADSIATATKKIFTESSHFWLLWCIPWTATPDISSSSENINNTTGVSRLSFRFLWLWYKTQNFLWHLINIQYHK